MRNYGIPPRDTRDDEDTGTAASCAFIGVFGGLLLCALAVLGLW